MTTHPTLLEWQPWSQQSFARAKKENRIILVNVAAAWCHWCHVMDSQTFSDPEIAGLLRDRFMAIRVDADARPDLAERYADWGWPATAVLTPDAEPITELRGFQELTEFKAFLRTLCDKQDRRILIGRTPVTPAPRPSSTLHELRDRVRAQLDRFFDTNQGGWGRFQKYPFPGPVEYSLHQFASKGDAIALGRAIRTLEGTLKLLDPVGGGCFQYSVRGVWNEPHHEKIAAVQAGCLESFTLAWQTTGQTRWLKAAASIQKFLLGSFQALDGGFYTSQDADVPDGRGGVVLGADYYSKTAGQRLRIGNPRTDTTVYADWNGLLIHALATHFEATGELSSLDAATNAGRRIVATHRAPAGAFRHAGSTDSLLHLRDNAAMGLALVALAEATGEDSWLTVAEGAATFVLDTLQAPEGGFWAHTLDPVATGAFAQRRKPLEQNGLTIRFLVALSHRSADAALADRCKLAAERAAQSLAHPDTLAPEAQIIGEFLLGVEALLTEPAKIVLTQGIDKAAALVMYREVLAVNSPGRVVRWARAEDEYPSAPTTKAYICRGTFCSPPIEEPARIGSFLRQMKQ